MSSAIVLPVIFWVGLLGTVYAYMAFPVLLALVTRRRDGTIGARTDARSDLPVTIIIPAYNEEASLEAKIRNALGADYPPSLLDVIVVSDASTDRTDEIARSFEAEGVRLIAQERRKGKTAGLNRAIAASRGEIVVFTDANAIFPPGTIRALVEYFREAKVGLVSGYTRYTLSESGDVAQATNAYTSLERIIKRAENQWGCCVGADGAIFAMRRSLYRTLRDDDINDFVLPLSVIDQGYQCLLAEDAFCSENPGKSLESEFRRQSRIANRSLRAICRHAHLLNPFRFPAFAFFLFSHKVMRFMVPVFLLVSGASLALLAPRGGIYLGLTAAALLAVFLLLVAKALPQLFSSTSQVSRAVRLLNMFVTINLAVLYGWWKFIAGDAEVTWQHDRALSR